MLILKVIFVSLWEPCFKVFRRNRSGRIQLSLWPLDVSGGSLGPDLGFRLACPPPLRQSSPWACPAHLCSLSPELSTEKVPSKCLMNGSDMLCSFLSKYWAISRQGPCCLLPVGILRLKEWMLVEGMNDCSPPSPAHQWKQKIHSPCPLYHELPKGLVRAVLLQTLPRL